MSAYPKLVQSNEPHPTAIELKDVQISFRLADGGRFDAVAESNLAVAENEFVAMSARRDAANPPCSMPWRDF